MKAFLAVPVLALSLLLPPIALADEKPTPNIYPQKGDITKNIHILFDKSSSMTTRDLANAYNEVQALVMQSTDEFNVAVSVFASGHVRMQVPKKVGKSKLGDNWLAMPSAHHYKRIVAWLQSATISSNTTSIYSAFQAILREDQRDVTVVVISDCIIVDWLLTLAMVKDATSKKPRSGKKPARQIKIGFVDTDRPVDRRLYATIRKLKLWYINVTPPEKEEEEDDEDEDEDDDS